MRPVVAFLLLLAGAVLVPLATAGWWAHGVLVEADGFVDTVAPLATEPTVRDEVEDRLVTETTRQVAGGTGLDGAQVEPLVRVAVRSAVADPAFARVWRTSTHDVHDQLVGVLSGPDPAGSADVGLELAPLSDEVLRELGAAGVPFTDQIPPVQATVPLLPASDLTRARAAYSLTDRWGPVLPFVALLLVALGLLAARRRARALLLTSVGVLLGLGLLAAAVALARVVVPPALPGSLPTSVAQAAFDTLVSGLWRDLTLVAVGALSLLVLAGLASGVRGRGAPSR